MSEGPVLDAATLAELRRLAQSRPRSGRQSVAKASAIRTLERLARERRRQPMPPMPEGWYPHEHGDPFYELDWVLPGLLLPQPGGVEGLGPGNSIEAWSRHWSGPFNPRCPECRRLGRACPDASLDSR